MPRDHYVPQMYLKYFATERDGFWVYDKDEKDPRFQTPINTAVERDFYSWRNAKGETDRRLESTLAAIESDAKPVLDRWLVRGARPDPEGRLTIATFMAFMHHRVPRQVRAASELILATAKEEMHFIAESDERLQKLRDSYLLNEGKDAGTPERLRELLKEPDKHVRLSADSTFALATSLNEAPALVSDLLAMNWCLCRAPRGSLFMTSDSPICIFGPLANGQVVFGGGVRLPAAQITFPMSPDVCLLLDHGHNVTRMSIGRLFVAEWNRRTAWNADQYVFSSVRGKAVARVVDEARGSRALPKMDEAEIRRGYRGDRGFLEQASGAEVRTAEDLENDI